MDTLIRFVLYFGIALVAILLAIILGDYGAWYLAWLLGTGLIVLVSAAGAALLDTQDQDASAGEH
jgi:ABC-type transport system involved in cytochrome c biogenesis permease component